MEKIWIGAWVPRIDMSYRPSNLVTWIHSARANELAWDRVIYWRRRATQCRASKTNLSLRSHGNDYDIGSQGCPHTAFFKVDANHKMLLLLWIACSRYRIPISLEYECKYARRNSLNECQSLVCCLLFWLSFNTMHDYNSHAFPDSCN